MRRPLPALMLMLAVAAGTARGERLPIKAFSTADGLAHVRASCVVVDSRGFIWFCSPAGLSRFDGQAFTTYGVPQGLTYDRVNHFLETTRGEYWVSTNGAGVYRFNALLQGPLADGAASRRPGDASHTRRFNPRRVPTTSARC